MTLAAAQLALRSACSIDLTRMGEWEPGLEVSCRSFAANAVRPQLHGRYVTFQVAVSRQMFLDILRLIVRLRQPPAPA